MRVLLIGSPDCESLTMRKQAPMSTAFILTSRSMGNWIPKLSVSVKNSFSSPVHCLVIRPTVCDPSFVVSCDKDVDTEGQAETQVQTEMQTEGRRTGVQMHRLT